jgi:uncharacterized membrane protein
MTAVPWRQLVWGLLLLAYALLVHYSNIGKAPPMLGALLALAPLLLVLATGLQRLRWRGVALPLMLAGCALLLWRLWAQIERHFDWIYLCQQCALYAALAAAFGRTLLPGQTPLCTRWAALVHGPLAAETLRYTRSVTWLWTAFFALIVIATLLLYWFARRSVWSLFVNFLILPAAALLFAAEFLWRRRSLPNAQHATLREMARLLTQGASLLGTDSPDGPSRAR